MMKEAELLEEIQYLLETIRDPEFTHQTLADLHIITQKSISIHTITTAWGHQLPLIEIRMRPTTPHCHLALQIGLVIRLRLNR